MAAIIVEHLHVRYRGAEQAALDDISLRVGRGECVLLTGATGCGKTTLLRTIAGLLQAEQVAEMRGVVFVNGLAAEHVNRVPDAPRAGVVFQNADDQLSGLTPREEIAFALENHGVAGEEANRRIDEALAFANLADRADDDINTLSGGQKQRICLAAVLAMEPDVLLLDEPVASLDAGARQRFIDLLMSLKQRGATMVIGTHEPEDFTAVADRNVRLESTGAAENGISRSVRTRTSWGANQESTLLEARGITARFGRDGFQLGPVSFSVRPGERIALLGPNGGGKSTLLSLLAGIVPWQRGEFFFDGKPVRRGRGPARRYVAAVSQNPDLMLFGRTVEAEVRIRPGCIGMDRAGGLAEADEMLRRFRLESMRGRSPFGLSQGQRQRLAIAAALSGGAKLILIDEPTTGQDQEHVQAVMAAVDDLADGGAAVLFSTHNCAVAAGLAERALVLVDGALVFDGAIAVLAAESDLLDRIGYGARDIALLGAEHSFAATVTVEEAGA